MFEAYAIGVTLKVNNLVTPELMAIGAQMERLEGIVQSLRSSFQGLKLNASAFNGISKGAEASHIAMDRASRSAAALERHLAALRATGASIPSSPVISPAPARPLLPGGGGGQGGGGGWHGNNRGGFHGGNVHMGPGGFGIGTVGVAAGDAFLPLAVTAGMLYGGHAVYESAKDLDTEKQRFKLYGLSAAQNSEAFDFVQKMRVYGTTQAENMRNFREAQGVFRESGLNDSSALEGAKLAAPVLAKLDFLASSLDEDSKAKMKTANMAMLRYVELSGGLKDAETFNRLADQGYRLNASSGGMVDWSQLLAMKKTSGTAGYNLTADALARLEPVIGELTGGRTGTGLHTAYNRITGITRIPNQVAHMMVDMGVWQKDKVEFNSQGGIKRINGNPMGSDFTKLFAENPELFYEKVMRPIYQKMKASTTDVERFNAAIFGRTGGAVFNAVERALPTIERSVEALKKTMGILDAANQTQKSLSGQEKEFDAAWTDFKTQFGTIMLPFFTGILKGGAKIFRGIANFIAEPDPQKPTSSVGQTLDMLTLPVRLGSSLGTFLFGPDEGAQKTDKPAVAFPAVKATSSPAPVRSVVFSGAPSAAAQAISDYARSSVSQVAGQGQQTSKESKFVAPKTVQTVHVSTQVNLDGRKVGEAVSAHQTREAARGMAGAAGFDNSQFLAPVGMR